MTPSFSARRPRVVASLAVLAMVVGARTGGQDQGDDAPPVVVPIQFELSEFNFNQWVYGNQAKGGEPWERLERTLSMSIAEVERSSGLSAPQKRKLTMAGHLDIKRFRDQLEAAHRVFEVYRYNQTSMDEIRQAAQLVGAALSVGLFGETSFYAKSISKTLSRDQVACYQAARQQAFQERRLFHYRAKVSLAVAGMDSTVGFTTDQSQRLIDLVLAETVPPAKLPLGSFESTLISYKICVLPENKIRPIFNDSQWKVLSVLFTRFRSQEANLRAGGFLDTTEPATSEHHQ